jgi:hypothetical protein
MFGNIIAQSPSDRAVSWMPFTHTGLTFVTTLTAIFGVVCGIAGIWLVAGKRRKDGDEDEDEIRRLAAARRRRKDDDEEELPLEDHHPRHAS